MLKVLISVITRRGRGREVEGMADEYHCRRSLGTLEAIYAKLILVRLMGLKCQQELAAAQHRQMYIRLRNFSHCNRRRRIH